MTYQVDIQTEVMLPDQIDEILEAAAIEALIQQTIASAALSILLTDDSRMLQLNHDFRGLKKTTDVLSFPAGRVEPEYVEGIPYLGDIAISLPQARNQALRNGHAVEAELQLLVVHGILHLLGYDHELSEDKSRMWLAQESILKQLGLHYIRPTEV